ncbi:hypothetical protein [Massilia cavernae]|uniref:hypothetical protein n=1 Tax=Massilia cavernae TaxID=2320864 RepID=UPI001C7216FF|nr:hypothetical protein [Massilia cavernae]
MDRTHQAFVAPVQALLVLAEPELPAALDAFAVHAERTSRKKKPGWGDDFPARECHIDEHANGCHAGYMDSALALWMSKKKFGGAPGVFKRGLAVPCGEQRWQPPPGGGGRQRCYRNLAIVAFWISLVPA